jgi:hypothetical protein
MLTDIKSYEIIPTLKGTIREIEKKYVGIPRIFLSNRNIFTYTVTRNWLLKNNLIDDNKDLLILTCFPEQKLYFLNLLVNTKALVIYYDDLSYNHENNKIQFYNHIISEIRNMDIKYFDYSHINNLNKND